MAAGPPVNDWLAVMAALLFWGPRNFLMATWGAYFDDSDNQGHFAVGGSVAECSTWESLSIEWNEVLGEGRWFHAKDFWSAHGQFGADAGKKEALYDRLVDIIEQYRVHPFAYLIPAEYARCKVRPPRESQPKGFVRAIKARTTRILDDHFCKGLAWGYNHAAGRLKNQPPDARLRVVVADTPSKNGFAEILYEMAKRHAKHRGRLADEITTQANPRDVVPLQVADLIAWETTRDRIEHAPRSVFLRLRRLGRFKVGQPPRMFDGWGPPDQQMILELLRDLPAQMGGDAEEA